MPATITAPFNPFLIVGRLVAPFQSFGSRVALAGPRPDGSVARWSGPGLFLLPPPAADGNLPSSARPPLRLAHDGADIDAERPRRLALRAVASDRVVDELAPESAYARLER